jgi:GTPase SAR1 family protein
MKIISASERLVEPRGAKILLLGPNGVGKTSLLKTLSPEQLNRTLLADCEAGDQAILDLPVATLRIESFPDMRDLACVIGGANTSFAPTMPYSQAHYNEAIKKVAPGTNFDKYDTIFVDSLTALSRLAHRWADQQPESFTERGKKDVRSVYGLLGYQMILLLNQIQLIRRRNVVFVAVLQREVDDFGRGEWAVQTEGQKTGRELPGIVDQVISMQWVDFGDAKPVRCFVCTSPNQWGYPAKDRSGRLNQLEKPNLGELLTKLTTRDNPWTSIDQKQETHDDGTTRQAEVSSA